MGLFAFKKGVLRMNILNIDIDKIIPYVNNPRNNEEAIDKVASSIQEFGFKVPIVIDKDNVVVTGHTRLLASKKLGLKTVPCVIADDLTETQIKAFRIADNKVSEYSNWDNELLKLEIDTLKDLDFDLELTGLKEYEIDSLYLEFDDFNDLEEAEDDLIEEYDEPVEQIEACCPNCGFCGNKNDFFKKK